MQLSLVWNDGGQCWIIFTSPCANSLDTVFAVVQELNPENQTKLGQRLELQKALMQRTSLYVYLYVYKHRAYVLSVCLSVLYYVELMLPLTLLCWLCSSCLSSLSIAFLLLTDAVVAAGNSWFWPGSHRYCTDVAQRLTSLSGHSEYTVHQSGLLPLSSSGS